MFDIGFPELLLVSLVMLLVFGPERLPEVLRNVGRFVGGARRSFDSLRAELEREVGADEIRREIHNSRIMDEAKRLGDVVRAERDEVEELLGKRYAALEAEGLVDRETEAELEAEQAARDELTRRREAGAAEAAGRDDGIPGSEHADTADEGSAVADADGADAKVAHEAHLSDAVDEASSPVESGQDRKPDGT